MKCKNKFNARKSFFRVSDLMRIGWNLVFAVAVVSGFGVVSGAGIAKAQRGANFSEENRDSMRTARLEKMAEKLGLTADQKTKLKEQHEIDQKAFSALRSAESAAEEELRKALASGDQSDEQLKALHEKAIEARTAMMRAHFQSMLGLRAMLTPEQREKFGTMAPFMGPQGKGRRHGFGKH